MKMDKQTILVIIAAMTLLVVTFGTFGPMQMVSTPEGVYEWDGGYVAEISGALSMEKSSYNIDQGEAPEFPTLMALTMDFSNLYHSTLGLQVFVCAGQISAYTNDIMVYNGNFDDVWYRENIPDYTVETRPFIPDELDGSGVLFSDLTFNVGDTFRVELKTDGIIHGSMFHDDEFGGYYEWDEWSMNWATTVASWEVEITGDGDDPPPPPPPPPGKGTLQGTVTDQAGVVLSGASVELIGVETAITDSVGFYMITDITPGSYGFEVTKTGYEQFQYNLLIYADEVKTRDAILTALNQPPPPPDQDSDGDGFTDAEELEAGTDPFDPNDFPTGPLEGAFTWNPTAILMGVIGITALALIFGNIIPIPGKFKIIVLLILAVLFAWLIWSAGIGTVVLL